MKRILLRVECQMKVFVSILCMMFIAVAGNGDVLHVAVSIPPQKYFVEKIGQNHIHVTVMMPPGANPHIYEPKPQQIVALSNVSLYFSIGFPFEKVWLNRFLSTYPHLRVIYTDEGIEKIPMTSHGGHHEDEGSLDPHIWLSPGLVMVQAATILDALKQIDPQHSDFYTENYNRFMSELGNLDKDLKRLFSEQGHARKFLVFHPSWGYFAHDYGLEQIAVEVEGKEPKPSDLMRVIETAKLNGIKAIFVQPQFSRKSAKAIASAIHGNVIAADPLAENWKENIERVAQTIHDSAR
jgi:zinc transport system substrate-binding protein